MADPIAAAAARRQPPLPLNEPARTYLSGSPERLELQARLAEMSAGPMEIPLIIGGEPVRTSATRDAVMPFSHHTVLARWHAAEPRHVRRAIDAALAAHRAWSAWPWEDRVAVLLKAAELLATRWRATVNSATMLGQGKTVHQSEIDAACELVDFLRFNAAFAADLYAEQPGNSAGVWNQSEYRPLEGFVYAVSPFNFTAIGGNLATAPVMMGGVAIWKPASTTVASAYSVMQALMAAGLPAGVINLVPGDAAAITDVVLASRDLAGVHFTGSTAVFNGMWAAVGRDVGRYRSYPRLVGETGGKDFVIVHASADPQEVAVALARGAFEYQGQKCSAASRVYVPRSLWGPVRDRLIAMMKTMRLGDVRQFDTFLSAVIDRAAFDRISGYLALAKRTARILQGGGADAREGYFIEPTLVQTTDPGHRLMREEIFGPVLTAYVYPDRRWHDTLALVERTSPYALTGAVFATDRQAIRDAASALRYAAGNFYVNDKPTGAVVGQQPFGGARASGTNDKAGSKLNLLRWVNARATKETFAPPREHLYPHMTAD
ncbi:MAG: L-glutamate gamma-semialdehyde dehydrogenase [Acidobacteria bacterium]|nr:L-glutamate gamma-semialdehyde dehydrogenase [Acidobacteriota bacterium]